MRQETGTMNMLDKEDEILTNFKQSTTHVNALKDNEGTALINPVQFRQ